MMLRAAAAPLSRAARLRPLLALGAAAALLAGGAAPAHAFGGILNDWQGRYGAQSSSADNAGCQLCHADATGGGSWNGYGWDVMLAREDPGCDLNGDATITNVEAFFCVELENSDNDGSGYDNITETGLSTQPGWTNGPFNTIFNRSGPVAENVLPPGDIGPVDPDGTEPPPGPGPPPPTGDEDLPPGQLKRHTIVVKPGQSIQAAIDRAQPGARIYILAGVYREFADEINALTISKHGIRLIGQTTPNKRVIIENAGRQRNGIAVVPDDRTDCMGCHVDPLEPPFPVLPGVEGELKMREPMIKGLEVRGITIRGFTNGLFTENVDGFRIVDVTSIDNHGYGIFPTLSKNGIITHSYASGSDDSGIWVETSQNVRVTHNLVEGNVNGFEISNSEDVVLAHNEARMNTVGISNLLLPDIFDDHPGSVRIDLRDNYIHDNNKFNSARPGSILSSVPKGIGILHLGVDQSVIANNRVMNHEFVGIGVADYCLAVFSDPNFNCMADPVITPEFLEDQEARDNRVENNVVLNNGYKPPGGLFDGLAADLSLVKTMPGGNCYAGNVYDTWASFFGAVPVPPACP